MRLKILIYGDCAFDRLGSSYIRAFQDLGHDVKPFDVRRLKKYLSPILCNRLSHRLTIKSFWFRKWGSLRWNRELLHDVMKERPALVLILNGEFLMPETITSIQSLGSRVFIFHADNPFPPNANSRPETLPSAIACDCYFAWSARLAQRLIDTGVHRAAYLPFAWDPELHPYIPRPAQLKHEIIFIGNWDREREELFEILAAKFPLRIWGSDYWVTRTKAGTKVRNCWQGGQALGKEMARIIRESKITLNLFRHQHTWDGQCDAVIMRSLEVPGIGGFLLTSFSEGHSRLFLEGQSGASFRSVEDCVQQVTHYLFNDNQREAIARNAHTLTASHHRYLDRAQTILQVLDRLSVSPLPEGVLETS